MGKYDFQKHAVAEVRSKWAHGARSVLLVAPTGAGKTVMGAELSKNKRTLWVAHRQELVFQAADKLRTLVGDRNVGIIMGDHPANPEAKIQVGTIETLISRMSFPQVDLVVLDEAHHYLASTWKYLASKYRRRGTLTLGLTATPERRTGEPLGDIFEELVIAAHYSELIERGVLVPPVMIGPRTDLGKNFAVDPVRAWQRFARGQQTFVFTSHVEPARKLADEMNRRRIPSAVIDWETEKDWRAECMAAFRKKQLTVLTNAFCLTEGVDVPDAAVGVGLRSFRFIGSYIQAYGRLLRAAPGKKYALLLDLCGAWHRHGSPAIDCEYALEGRAITPREGQQAPKGPHPPGMCVDQKIYVLDPGPLRSLPLPRLTKTDRTIDIARARRMRRHGMRAVEKVIAYMNGLN